MYSKAYAPQLTGPARLRFPQVRGRFCDPWIASPTGMRSIHRIQSPGFVLSGAQDLEVPAGNARGGGSARDVAVVRGEHALDVQALERAEEPLPGSGEGEPTREHLRYPPLGDRGVRGPRSSPWTPNVPCDSEPKSSPSAR